jgi:hypothetical protein
MEKYTPYLDFYNRHIVNGRLSSSGLCNCNLPKYNSSFDLMKPTHEDMVRHRQELQYPEHIVMAYWAAGLPLKSSINKRAHSFTPLRQNIILFLAAMNNEL